MQFFNQNSLWIGGLILITLISFFRLRDGVTRRDGLVIGAVIGVLILGWAVFRPRASQVAGADEIRARIGAGKPVLLEFQSPY